MKHTILIVILLKSILVSSRKISAATLKVGKKEASTLLNLVRQRRENGLVEEFKAEIAVASGSAELQLNCFDKGKVCNSLSDRYPKSFEDDFESFSGFTLSGESVDDRYVQAFSEKFIGTTKSVFGLYSLCHESFPDCSKNQGKYCHCNTGRITKS